MSADQARLFVALWPAQEVRAALRDWRDAWIWPSASSPVRTQQLHVTLHFLGNMERARVPELVAGLGVPFTPFELRFGHPELWHGGIAVLAPDVVPQPLMDLHASIGAALEGLGITPEGRAYKPHVTMGRRAGNAVAPAAGPDIRWQIDGYALMESKLGAGSEFGVVQHYSCGD
jgi:2'-5' RNA ligase